MTAYMLHLTDLMNVLKLVVDSFGRGFAFELCAL